MAEKKDYKYYAFISYSRKNSKAAAYFHRQLEHFRIPVKYVAEENRPPKQKFLRPIFRDRRDLEANENSFTEDIKKALEQSRYLIVLCSPESAHSKWVDEEIKHFLETHNNDYRLIVPVVLYGCPGCTNETECLPLSLQLGEITSRNLPSMIPDEGEDEKNGWLTGVVQSMSYMLKVNKERIRATVDAERVRQAKIYSFIGIASAMIFAGLACWAIKAEREAESNRIEAEENWRIAERNRERAENNEKRAILGEKEAKTQRDKAEENWRIAETNRIVAESNQRKAEENEKRALKGEQYAREKKELSDKTLEFIQKMLQEGKPDKNGQKNIMDLLMNQVSKIELLEPEELRISVSLCIGKIMLEQGLKKSAERLFEIVFRYAKDRKDYDGMYEAAMGLGVVYSGTGRGDKAQKMFDVINGNKLYAERKDGKALLLYNMAWAYHCNGEKKEAVKCCEIALKERVEDVMIVARLKYILAFVLLSDGQIGKATVMCSEMLEALKKERMEPTCSMKGLYGQILMANKKYDESRKVLTDAMNEEVLKGRQAGSNFASILHLLGQLEIKEKKYDAAPNWLEKALLIEKKSHPNGNGLIATIYNDMGFAHEKLGNFLKAKKCYESSLELHEKVYGNSSLELVGILNNLGYYERNQGNIESARTYFNRIISICTGKEGESIRVAEAKWAIAKMYIHENNYLSKIEEVMELYKKHKFEHTGDFANILNDYALGLYMRGERLCAIDIINRAADIAQTKLSVKGRANILKNRELILENAIVEYRDDSKRESRELEDMMVEAHKEYDKENFVNADVLYRSIAKKLKDQNKQYSGDYSLVCNRRGMIASHLKKYNDALKFYIKARDIDVVLFGTNSLESAIAHQNIGDVLYNLGEYHGAGKAYRAALEVRKSLEKKDEESLSVLYTDLARTLQKIGRLNEAKDYFQKAYDIDLKKYGECSMPVANDCEDIGDLLFTDQEYDSAISNYCSALKIFDVTKDAPLWKKGYLCNQIGVAYCKVNKLRLAKDYYQKSYQYYMDCEGEGRNSIRILGNIADIERECGLTNDAIKKYEKIIGVMERDAGYSLQELAIKYNCLAIAYSAIGKHDKSIDAHRESLKRNLKVYGREHREIMVDYWNLALEFKAMKQNEEEKDFLRKSLDVALVLCDENSKEVLERYEALAECLSRLEKYENESKIRKKILEIKLTTGKSSDMSLAKAYSLYALALHNAFRFETAVMNYMEAMKIYEKGGSNFKESLAVVLFNIGNAMMSMGKYQDSLRAYEESYKIVKENNIGIAKGHFLQKLPKKIEENIAFVRKDACVAIKITKVLAGGEAKQLGVKINDIWLSIGDWRAEDALKKQADIFWKSASETWDSLKHTNRVFSIGRKIGDKWERKSFEFTKESGGFHYELISMERRSFDEMMRQCFINVK